MSSDTILPSADILKKLQDIEPSSFTWILDRFQAIGREENEPEDPEFLKRALKPNWKGLLQGGSNLFDSLPLGSSCRAKPPVITSDSAEYSRIFRNNILRLAIRQYCVENPEVADRAGLTRRDWEELEPIPYPASGRAGSVATPAIA